MLVCVLSTEDTLNSSEQPRGVLQAILSHAVACPVAPKLTTGVTYRDIKVSGNSFTSLSISRPVSTDAATRVMFRQMDPCCIAPDIGQFDAVLLDDIVDKLISPKAPFGRMGGVSPIVKPGGPSRAAAPPSCVPVL